MLSVAASLLLFLPVAERPVHGKESVGHYQDFGDAKGFLNVLPPGQRAALTGSDDVHVRDQFGMYGDLVHNAPGLTDGRLTQFFKDASFGVRDDDVERVYSPTAGVTVVRDKTFGVPHIFGDTRYATMFAQGYTAGEDRLFLMDVLRHLGRARLSEFIGASPANQQLDRGQLSIAPYTEADLTAQIESGRTSGPEGEPIYADGVAYRDGVNAYIQETQSDPSKLPIEYPALQQTLAPWKLEDTIAIASLVGGIFGRGGGGELDNLCGIKRLAQTLGSAGDARAVFDDLKFANDPDAPTTSHLPAPYMPLGPVDSASHPDVNCSSLTGIGTGTPVAAAATAGDAREPAHTVDVPWGSFTLDLHRDMSNAMLIDAAHSDGGHPIAVFGPQTGYTMPQLLVEKDVHGPGIDARGVAFAGTDVYVQLGRGRDFAWSATSSGADNTDQWALRLCEPDGSVPTTSSMGYVHNGACAPIESFQHVQTTKPSTPGDPPIVLSWRVERTVDYGPLQSRGTLDDGTPIAIASRRSTYGGEITSARGFYRVNDPAYMTHGFDSFRSAIGAGIDFTFNWFYVDGANIGYQHSCKCPVRAVGVDPYLPSWGTGQWDWQGFVAPAAQPWDFNPPQGYITSWNNKPAPGFTANDRQFSYGPVFRSQLLSKRIEETISSHEATRSDIVNAMADAGTVDLRGEQVLPLLLRVLGPIAPDGSDPRTQEMRDRLAVWLGTQAHRVDRDEDGSYDDPQSPAIMDAWWPRLAHAMFDATSGNAIDALGIGLHDPPQGHEGSAFDDGFYGHAVQELRAILGKPAAQPWSREYCGAGDLNACRAALWTSLGQAASDLQTEFGSPAVGDWKRSIADDEIRATAIGVNQLPPLEWINRPTFQQVVQAGVELPRPSPTATASVPTPAVSPVGVRPPNTGSGSDGTRRGEPRGLIVAALASVAGLVALSGAALVRRR